MGSNEESSGAVSSSGGPGADESKGGHRGGDDAGLSEDEKDSGRGGRRGNTTAPATRSSAKRATSKRPSGSTDAKHSTRSAQCGYQALTLRNVDINRRFRSGEELRFNPYKYYDWEQV